jgi:hypothetical protein
MRTRLRFLLILMLVAFLVVTGGAALAQEAGDVLAADDGPAVEAPPEAAEDEEQPWTARYLAPTVLLLGVVALGGSVLYYAVRIRGRYVVK